jgi:hypothetical protein
MAELGAFFGNPNIQRQGARARALAGQRDVNTLADPRTYAIVQGLLGTAPDQMGLSVLNPDYEKIRKAAEPAFALGLLGQAAPLLAPMTKGLPVGASIQNVGKDLSAIQIGDRTIPVTINRIDKKSGGQLVNVNPSAFDEAFSKTGWQYVGEKGKEGISGRYEKFENFLKDAKSIEASNVSVNKDGGIVFGDGRHRYAVLRDMGLDELPIVMDKESIKNAKKFGYLADSPKTPIAPRQEALDKAQRNAALPVEEGGLGLPKDNTPEMRAEAMGFDKEVLHGTSSDIDKVIVLPDGRRYVKPFYTTADNSQEAAEFASQFANTKSEVGSPRVMPLMIRGDVLDTRNNPEALRKLQDIAEKSYTELKIGEKGLPTWGQVNNYATEAKNAGIDSILLDERSYLNSIANLNPNNIRSRFAAFDPMRRNEPDLLAGVLPLGLLADEEQRKKLYELVPSLLGQ